MPLQDQIIPILMSGGIETKVDQKSVQLGKLLTLENGVFERPGKIRKRNGYDALPTIPGVGIGINSNQSVNTLLGITEDVAYTYSVTKNDWTAQGALYNLDTKVQPEIDNYLLRGSFSADMAIVGGYEIYSYATGVGSFLGTSISRGVQYTVKDRITKDVTYETSITDVGNLNFYTKIVSDVSFAYQLKTSTSSVTAPVVVTKIDPTLSNPTVSSINLTRTGATSTDNRTMDALVTSTGIYIAYYSAASASQLTLVQLDSSLAVVNSVVVTVPAPPNGGSVSIAYDGTNIYLFYAIPGNAFPTSNAYYRVYTPTLGVVTGETAVYSVNPWGAAETYFGSFYQVSLGVSLDNVILLTAIQPPSPISTDANFSKISKTVVSSTAVILTDNSFCNVGVLGSKMVRANGKNWVVLGYNAQSSGVDTGDSSFWLQEVTLSGLADVNALGSASRFLYGNAYAIDPTPSRARPELIFANDTITCALQVKSSLAVKSSTEVIAVYAARFSSLDAKFSGTSSVPDSNYLLTNSSPKIFDTYVSEQSFNWAPFVSPNATPIAGGGLAAGSYTYYAIWEWIDAYGQVHQSSPSAPVTMVVPGAGYRAEVKLSPFVNTTKPNNLILVLYRTVVNGVTPYRLPLSTYIFNKEIVRDETNAVFTFNDTGNTANSDAEIVNNQILYTTGGILPNDPAPNFKFQWLYKNRVMLGGLDDGNSVWYSKTRVLGEPVKFSGFFLTNVDIAGGDVTAGGTLDDKCIFFKKNKIFYMYGDGPNDAGGGQAFSIPQEISSPVGCAYPKSVVATPNGLMFKSEKGIYLLDRGLNVQYIGAPVEYANGNDVTSALNLAQYNQVIFTLDNGTALFYDYLVGQWGTYTNVSAVGSTLFENQHTYIQTSGVVKQQGGTFLDSDTTPIELKIGLPWIKLAGLSGFERAKQLMLVGENVSAHTLSVSMAYDYNDTYVQTAQFTPTAPVLQERIFLTQQKCEAFKVLITDNATSTSGEGYSLSELGVLLGMKKGFFKVSSAKSTS